MRQVSEKGGARSVHEFLYCIFHLPYFFKKQNKIKYIAHVHCISFNFSQTWKRIYCVIKCTEYRSMQYYVFIYNHEGSVNILLYCCWSSCSCPHQAALPTTLQPCPGSPCLNSRTIAIILIPKYLGILFGASVCIPITRPHRCCWYWYCAGPCPAVL